MIAPIRQFDTTRNISQLFGVNKAVYSRNFGIPGHNGLDIVIRDSEQGYGREILAAHDGVVAAVTFDNLPLHTRGNGVYIDTKDQKYTTVYWHLSSILVSPGQKVSQGEVIGLMGNSGFVLPTPTKECPNCGTHLHFAVKSNWQETEYGGFVDPIPFIHNGGKYDIRFLRDLWVGSSGDDISWLQTILKLEGFAEDYVPIGYFGYKTLRDVKQFQKKHGINPTLGYVGPKTRELLNNLYTIYG